MPYTVEEINGADFEATLTPEIEAALLPKIVGRATKYLETAGHVVKKKEDYETEVKTETDKRNKAFLDSESPKFYGAIDAAVKYMGFPKPDGTPTVKWVEKLSADGKLPFTKEQLDKLEAALKADGGGSTQQSLIDELRKEIEKKDEEAGKKDDEKFKKFVSRAINTSLKAAPVLMDTNLKTEADKNAFRTAAVADLTHLFNTLYEGAEDNEGVLGYKKKGTDAFLMDTVTGEPYTPLEIVRKFHPIFLAPAGHQQEGIGGGNRNGNSGSQQQQGKRTEATIHVEAANKGLRKFSDAWKTYVDEEMKKLQTT